MPAPPPLLGLFSWTALAAHALQERHPMTQRRAAWYDSRRPPSWTPSPWCDATCGWRQKVFHCPSPTHKWEETVHIDTGLLGMTTKHLYFAGSRKKFRVRYDRSVSVDPYDDGFGIMRDAQAAKPRTFRTGDGWFAYNLAANLAQAQG